jgi:hypothetical protein
MSSGDKLGLRNPRGAVFAGKIDIRLHMPVGGQSFQVRELLKQE